MAARTLGGHLGVPVALDICFTCQAFWFDARESLQLTPGSTLELFRIIGEHAASAHHPAPSTARCPRCQLRLIPASDLQRATRFRYHRCPQRHGRFITFFDFLREKNFIRPLTGPQIEELRRHVAAVNCSNCGAPIDLAKRSTCGHCGSALSMLDLKQAGDLVEQLRAATHQSGRPIDPAMALDLERARREVTASFDAFERGSGDARWFRDVSSSGLVGAGLSAIARWMKG
jgi:hypothetical protein